MNKVMALTFSMRSHNDIYMDYIAGFTPRPSSSARRLPDFLPVTVNVPTTPGEKLWKGDKE